MAKSTVAVKFLGDISDLKRKMGEAEGSAGSLGSKFGGAGVAAAAGMAVAGAAVAGFAAKSASTFADVGKEVLKLQRYTGQTAEDASRLRFAFKQAGIDVDTGTRSLGLFSKNLAGTKLDKLGFSFKDASGKLKPLNDDLLQVAKRFEGMANGPEKTALAMQLFGRGGAAMLPFLNRGADGIADLMKQSDKLGETLSGKDLEAVKESTKNHRLFSAAMEGIQIQIGRYVLPIMTKFVGFLAASLGPAMRGVQAVMAPVGAVLGTLGDIAGQVFDILFKGDFTGGPFAEDSSFVAGAFKVRDVLVIVKRGVEDFIQTWQHWQDGTTSSGNFGKIEKAAIRLRIVFNQVSVFVRNNLKPILITLGVVVLGLLSPFALAAAALVALYVKSETFREVVALVATAVGEFVAYVVKEFSDLSAAVQQRWAAISEAVSHVVNVIRDVVTVVVNIISALWRAWGDDLLHIAQDTFGAIASSVQNAMQVVKGIIDVVVALINGDWGAAWDGVKEIFSGVWAEIVNQVTFAINLVRDILGGVLSTIQQVWQGAWDKLAGAVTGTWDGIFGFLKGIPGRILDAVGDLSSLLFNAGKQVLEGFLDGLQAKSQDVKAYLTSFTAALPAMAGATSVDYGTVSQDQWDSLFAAGWRGDPTDNAERLYAPTAAAASPAGGGGLTINVDARGSVGIDSNQVAGWVAKAVKKARDDGWPI